MRMSILLRWTSAVLLLLLWTGSSGVPARGASAGRREALEAVERFFTLPAGVQLTPTRSSGRLTWSVAPVEQSREPLAEVDAETGRLLWVDLARAGRRLQAGPLGEPYPRADALARAWNLVRLNRPELTDMLRPAPDWFDWPSDGWDFTTYRFTWMPFVNGVPVLGSQVSVTVDRYSGQLLSLLGGYPVNGVYAPAQVVLDQVEALRRYQESAQPRLVYQPAEPEWEDSPMRLVYRFDEAQQPMDPLDGHLLPKVLTVADYPIRMGPSTPLLPFPTDAATPRPTWAPTDDQAIAYAAEVLGLSPEQAAVGISRSNGGLGISFEASPTYGQVALDPDTGFLRLAWRSTSPMAREAYDAVDPTAAKQAAIAVVQRYYAPWTYELGLPFAENPGENRSFFFPRHFRGIQVLDEGIRVVLNDQLEWSAIVAEWSPHLALPDPADAISPQEAAQTFFARRAAVLAYQPALTPEELCVTMGAPDEVPMQLVYYLTGPDSATAVDALTGRVVGPTRSPAELAAGLSGHWAQGELLLLSSVGLLGAELSPNTPMTRAQAYRFLIAYESSPEMPGLTPPNPDQPVTRAEFVTWVARTLGLGPLARSPLPLLPVYTDLAGLTLEQRNAANFLNALGLLKAGGRFRGDD
ncbi:MAG: hypothetical protein ACM3XM_14475, partial [Mycobacterium leprae]